MSARIDEIAAALTDVRTRIELAAQQAGRDPREIELIAVTKTFPVSDARILYSLGIRQMGENRDDEGAQKSEELADCSDISWHFQGQVQSRKIPSIAAWADVVHSLDEISHAQKFARQQRIPEFFLQVNLEPERADRGGVAPEKLTDFLEQLPQEILNRVRGLMTVAPLGQEPTEAFNQLTALRNDLSRRFPMVKDLSMGMSNDFEAAIKAGATQIRVGSSILGSRAPLT